MVKKRAMKKIKQNINFSLSLSEPASIEEMRSKEREDGNNAERDDGRGVNRESFGAEEAPSARTRAAGRRRAVGEAGV